MNNKNKIGNIDNNKDEASSKNNNMEEGNIISNNEKNNIEIIRKTSPVNDNSTDTDISSNHINNTDNNQSEDNVTLQQLRIADPLRLGECYGISEEKNAAIQGIPIIRNGQNDIILPRVRDRALSYNSYDAEYYYDEDEVEGDSSNIEI